MKPNDFNFDIARIDEEGLLPGTSEPTDTSGVLHPTSGIPLTRFCFAPITEQDTLNSLNLHSKGEKLQYALSNAGHSLHAITEKNVPVFDVSIDNEGTYTFTLKNHIDRPAPVNLVKNGDFSKAVQPLKHGHQGWNFVFNEHHSTLFQQIPTDANTSYQLTLLLLPFAMKVFDAQPLQIFWNDQLIHTLAVNQEGVRGLTFTLDGNPDGTLSKLSLVSTDPQVQGMQFVEQVMVSSQAQHQLPLDFQVGFYQGSQLQSHEHFVVNVTTTPPIELNNQIPFDIYYEQTAYQTIIVSDEGAGPLPLNKINLDALFNNLAIPAEQRHVEVVQREENGQATNVYEVKISDINTQLEPITVADVQLSFPGGDGGLHVFQRNIQIDDGGSTPPPPNDLLI